MAESSNSITDKIIDFAKSTVRTKEFEATKKLIENGENLSENERKKAEADILIGMVPVTDVLDYLTDGAVTEAAHRAIDVVIQPDKNPDFKETLEDVKDYSMHPDRDSEPALVSENSGASITIRNGGEINLSSSKYSQIKLDPGGAITESAIEARTVANRKKLTVSEIVVNEHKMNPNLYEFTDFKEIKLPSGETAVVGNFCVSGSILVKAWEPNLKRYMLIRRPCRMPMFGNLLNVPEINPAINVDDPMLTHEEILAQSSQGYQVNGLIQDAKSLIGKQGVDRDGINRYIDGMGDAGSGSSIGGFGGAGGGTNVTYGDASKSVKDGLAAAEQSLLGTRMDNGANGCAEAATKIGSYYSKFLKKELDNGVVSVAKLYDDAIASGVKIERYDGGTIAAGDVIVYWDGQGGNTSEAYDHVVVSDGRGGYIGNSSSQQQIVHGSDAENLGRIVPYYIIKTSQA